MTTSPVETAAATTLLRVLERVVPAGLVFLRADGTPLHVNEAARALLRDRDLAVLWREVRRAPDPGEGGGRELRLSATERPVWAVHLALDEPGLEGHLVLLQPADSVRALETDLRFANRMRGLQDSVRVMAHDVKAPLNAIVLRLDLLQDDLAALTRLSGKARESLLEHVEVVQEELTRVNRILQSFLSQTGPAREKKRVFDLRRVVREVATLARPLAAREGVRAETRIGPEPIPVLGFRDQIKQALINLATNGLEAMHGRSGVSLRFDARRRDGFAELLIEDEGHGVSPDAEKHLFEMHYTTKPHGSGIGLFVVRAILREHGGSIDLASREGGGATARVRIPLASEAP